MTDLTRRFHIGRWYIDGEGERDVYRTHKGMKVTFCHPTLEEDLLLGYFDLYTGKIYASSNQPCLNFLPVKRLKEKYETT